MPEDALKSFMFEEIRTTPSMTLAERLAQDIVQQSIMSRLDPAPSAHGERSRSSEEPAPEWEGNVPPDFSEEFGFLF